MRGFSRYIFLLSVCVFFSNSLDSFLSSIVANKRKMHTNSFKKYEKNKICEMPLQLMHPMHEKNVDF